MRRLFMRVMVIGLTGPVLLGQQKAVLRVGGAVPRPADGYRVVFALAERDAGFTDRVVILADKVDGTPLPESAAPFQIIVPGEKRPARWIRQVWAIDIVDAPRS